MPMPALCRVAPPGLLAMSAAASMNDPPLPKLHKNLACLSYPNILSALRVSYVLLLNYLKFFFVKIQTVWKPWLQNAFELWRPCWSWQRFGCWNHFKWPRVRHIHSAVQNPKRCINAIYFPQSVHLFDPLISDVLIFETWWQGACQRALLASPSPIISSPVFLPLPASVGACQVEEKNGLLSFNL